MKQLLNTRETLDEHKRKDGCKKRLGKDTTYASTGNTIIGIWQFKHSTFRTSSTIWWLQWTLTVSFMPSRGSANNDRGNPKAVKLDEPFPPWTG